MNRPSVHPVKFLLAVSLAAHPGFALGQIAWQSAVASFETPGGPVSTAIDGIVATGNGWNVQGGHMSEQSAVFITRMPQDAVEWQARLVFMGAEPMAYPNCFELAVTRDPAPTLESEWTPLQPSQAVAICGDDYHNGASLERSLVRLANAGVVRAVEVRARSPIPKITAFRINLVPGFSVSQASSITRNPEGACTISEFEVLADPMQTTNVAKSRPVIASGPVEDGLPSLNLTDGLVGTFSHLKTPLAGGGKAYFEVDLGQSWPIDHLRLRGQTLGGAMIELRDDRGENATWTCNLPWTGEAIRRDARDGAGPSFTARWLRIGAGDELPARQPEIAEVEVYPKLRPFILQWFADGRAMALRDVPAGTRNLHFEISAPAPSPVEAIRHIRYRIPGWSDAWSQATPGGGINMAVPPPGFYQIELEALHSDGVWDGSGQPFALTVLPVWWQARSFILGTIALVSLGGFLGWRHLHIRQLARELTEARRQGELESNRLRIARDMHDDIGARLTHLAYLADAADQASATAMQDVAAEARETVGALDQIVWAVNPRNDTVGGFVEYLSVHAAGYFAATAIRLREDIVVASPDRTLGFEIRHMLMMASKEALQNILKHSDATEASIAITDAAGVLAVVFSDNGRGFEAAKGNPDQSGLDNMRERLHECGGTCAIESASAQGVRVTFRLPLDPVAPNDRH